MITNLILCFIIIKQVEHIFIGLIGICIFCDLFESIIF